MVFDPQTRAPFVHVEREISGFGCHTHSWYLVVTKFVLALSVNERMSCTKLLIGYSHNYLLFFHVTECLCMTAQLLILNKGVSMILGESYVLAVDNTCAILVILPWHTVWKTEPGHTVREAIF